MKLLSWNVNGIRAAEKNGFLDVLKSEDADLVCLQEIKAFPAQLSASLRCTPGFRSTSRNECSMESVRQRSTVRAAF